MDKFCGKWEHWFRLYLMNSIPVSLSFSIDNLSLLMDQFTLNMYVSATTFFGFLFSKSYLKMIFVLNCYNKLYNMFKSFIKSIIKMPRI